MKRTIYLLMMCLTVVSCSKEDAVDVIDDNVEVELKFSPYLITPMHSTRAATRAAGDVVEISQLCSRLDIYIVCGDDVTTINQTSSDEGFGSIHVTMSRNKSYNVYALAHNNSFTSSKAGEALSFQDGVITDMFYYSCSLTPTVASVNCSMSHVVGKFSLWMTDAIPDNVTKFRITASNSGTKLGLNGTAADVNTITKTFESWTSAASGTMFSMYIIPTTMDEIVKMSFTVEALDGDDNIVLSRVFSDVDIRNGYKTMYKGKFFTIDDLTFSFTGTDWYSFDTVNF